MTKIYLISVLFTAFFFVKCSEQEPIIEYITITETVVKNVRETVEVELNPYQESTLQGIISADLTLDPTKTWLLKGRVAVEEGITLTIPAGTIIKAAAGTGADASTLIISRGAKIMAEGTLENPIIMTSISDNIELGGTYPVNGPSLTVESRGLWGGLLILGNAPCSFSGDVTELQIEGIPTSDTNGLYGGTDPNDNSGVISFFSIRHGGAEIGEGNEINGLTLGGVGSKTTVNNIEIIATVDDGIEFFGGNVNANNLIIWGQGDDGIDIDQGYSGVIDGAMVVLTDASDHGLEIDGPEGSAKGSFTLKNIIVQGATFNCSAMGVDGEMADFRKGSTGHLENILFRDFAIGKDIELDGSEDATTYMSGELTFKDISIMYPLNTEGEVCDTIESLEKIFDDKSDESSFEIDAKTFATIVNNVEEELGIIQSNFSWTFYSKN